LKIDKCHWAALPNQREGAYGTGMKFDLWRQVPQRPHHSVVPVLYSFGRRLADEILMVRHLIPEVPDLVDLCIELSDGVAMGNRRNIGPEVALPKFLMKGAGKDIYPETEGEVPHKVAGDVTGIRGRLLPDRYGASQFFGMLALAQFPCEVWIVEPSAFVAGDYPIDCHVPDCHFGYMESWQQRRGKCGVPGV
jgi:hypothetical protein